MRMGRLGVDGWTDGIFLNKINSLRRPPPMDVGWTGWTDWKAAATGPTAQTCERLRLRGVTDQRGIQKPPKAATLLRNGLQR